MRMLIGTDYVDLVSLAPNIDDGMLNIFRACLAGVPADYSSFKSAVVSYLASPSAKHDGYIQNFVILWQHFFKNRHFEQAEQVWKIALEPVFDWEQTPPGAHLHKGTPYYFWAMTAFEAGKLDTGFALMHQALEEDRRASAKFQKQPAFNYATLNFQEVRQAYRPRVQTMAEYVDRILATYRSQHARRLTLPDVRRRFLKTPPDIETVFLFTYVVGRLLELKRIPDHAMQSLFAGQMEANILFDLALIIDAGIHHKNPNNWRFVDHASFLARRTKIPLTKKDLRQIGKHFRSNFDSTLQQILNLTYTVTKGPIDPLGARIAVAYGMRNRGAHNVAASATFYQQFSTVHDWMFECFFLMIEALY